MTKNAALPSRTMLFVLVAGLTTAVACGSDSEDGSDGDAGGLERDGAASGSSGSSGGAGKSGSASGSTTGGSGTTTGKSGSGTSGATSGSSGSASGKSGNSGASSGASGSATSGAASGSTGSTSGNSGSTTSGSSGSTSGATGSSGASGTSGTSGSSGTPDNSKYPCDGTTAGYNATMIKSGSTWTVTNGGSQKYSGSDTVAALTAAYESLSAGRTTKQSILVQGDGVIPASAQVNMPSYTVVNWCGTLNISGSSSGDKSPFYARNKTDVEIANLKMTGSPSYGIFFRGTNNMVLGNIDLKLSGGSPGIGIRVDTSASAGSDRNFVKNLKIGRVTGGGMSSQLVETYGVDGITIGTVEGEDVGECGLLLNRSINAEVDTVRCTDCGTGTGYAAFRVANSVGKIGSDWPADNVHVKSVYARGGGRGIFSVSGCGGLTIDNIDIADTGNTSILLQNTYNTTIAAVAGKVVGGLVQISNDTNSTTSGRYPPSKNVAIKNLVLSGGASVRQDWCAQYGTNGCTATNVTGGTVSMCK